jgi:ABC-type dipeptide/oligopeptide/nickel transport system permease subunit
MTDASAINEADLRALNALRRKNSIMRRLLREPAAALALLFIVLVVLGAIFAPLIAPYDPYANNMRLRLKAPGFVAPDGNLYLLGTDAQGRDMLTRILYGLRTTLAIGALAVLAGGSIGVLIGALSAYYKRLDAVLMRLIDVLLSFPSILFGLALAAVLGPNFASLVISLSIAAVPAIARVSRGAATVVMQQEYMEAGRALGLGDGALIWRYLLLNCGSTVLIYATLQLGQSILLGSVLSFLGLGVQPPIAELGSMTADGRKFLTNFPYVATIPAAVIFLIVLAFNILGDALRDALDPKLRQ